MRTPLEPQLPVGASGSASEVPRETLKGSRTPTVDAKFRRRASSPADTSHEAYLDPATTPTTGEEQYPDPVFLVGKLLNALLLDPVSYDLQVLDGLNKVMGVLDSTLSPEERARFDQVLIESRGSSYRRIPTLAFEPSQNISLLAGRYLRAHLPEWELGNFYEWLLGKAAAKTATWESDLASYLMFDGGWADELISLGRRDVLERRDEVRAFFEEPAKLKTP